jgi:2-dehydro-3-deoxyglucarate aldolase/4-hydroxy-2-oxoheptanedioate aldolase
MQINNLEKFRKKVNEKLCLGIVITLTDPTVSELAGDIGWDFSWIDMEHAPLNIETVMRHISAVRGTDCAPFVRVPWNEHGVIKPVLDLAPAGVIIPMVNSATEAAAAVAACKYPPGGNRGCGVRRGSRYGRIPFDEYLRISEKEPMVIVQIEHVDAVKNLDAILKVPGIDSICVGPCDLSGSMGKLNQLDDREVCQVIDEVCRKTLAAGIMLGTAGGTMELCRQRGMHWAALDSDCGSIISQAERTVNNIDNKGNRYV